MKIAKPMLLVLTPIGVGWGLLEAWRFHWWLAVLMGVLLGVISLFMWGVVRRVRREKRERQTGAESPDS
jgi:heme/copper-type cytochrome/quinol oxidase subunit 2